MKAEIETLYRVFSRYRHPSALEGCPCCTSPAEARPLLTTPLRQLKAEALCKYAGKALTTWGSLSDYKYFLPRILEHSTDSDVPWCIEAILNKLAYGDFASWPQPERIAVEGFIGAWWADCVARTDVEAADSVLCGAASFMGVVALLEQPIVSTDFKQSYRWNCARGDKQRLINAFWNRDSAAYQEVLRWVYAEA